MSYNEAQLRQAVDAVFVKYDKDGNGKLDSAELSSLINDALVHMKQPRQVSQQEVTQFIKTVDQNNDGLIEKGELYDIFTKVLNQPHH